MNVNVNLFFSVYRVRAQWPRARCYCNSMGISSLDDLERKELHILRALAVSPNFSQTQVSTTTNSPAHSQSLRSTIGDRCQEAASGLTASHELVCRWGCTRKVPEQLRLERIRIHALKALHLKCGWVSHRRVRLFLRGNFCGARLGHSPASGNLCQDGRDRKRQQTRHLHTRADRAQLEDTSK